MTVEATSGSEFDIISTMNKILLVASLFLTAGCWTFDETAYPSAPVTQAPAKGAPSVQLAGFTATFTRYDTVRSFQTVYVPGYCGRRYYSPGYVETVPVTTYVPRACVSDHYLRRARNAFESAGFTIAPATADRIIEVDFEGPYVASADFWKSCGWQLGTLFFCDYAASSWTAKLRVRDGKTGKLLFTHDYDQRFETHVFGLIPLFSISSCDATALSVQQNWCLSALTDRAVADATAFLSKP